MVSAFEIGQTVYWLDEVGRVIEAIVVDQSETYVCLDFPLPDGPVAHWVHKSCINGIKNND